MRLNRWLVAAAISVLAFGGLCGVARGWQVTISIGSPYVVLNDDDDNNNGVPDWDEDPVTGELDDLVELWLSRAPDDDVGTITLDASPRANVKVWTTLAKAEEVHLPKTWDDLAEEDLPILPYWVEGGATGAVELTLIWDNEVDPCGDAANTTVVTLDDTIAWGTYGINTPIDNHPANPNNGGKRIFPGKRYYDESPEVAATRKKVFVTATITPALADVPVYFSWWDVDDPSSNTAPIDEDDIGGLGYGDDNRGSGESLNEESAETYGSGNATVVFTVSMQPGDNFKICASLHSNALGKVDQPKVDGRENMPLGVTLSEMLTTWRKLHVEVDSMDSISGNTLTGQIQEVDTGAGQAWLTIEDVPNDWEEDDHFVPGRIKVDGYNDNNWYEVYGFDCNGNDVVMVINDPNLLGCENQDYWLEDDDTITITGIPPRSLPSCPDRVVAMDLVFEDAYVDAKVYPEAPDYDDDTGFILNTNVNPFSSSYWKIPANANEDMSSSGDFWHVHVTSAFQHKKDMDYDPDSGLVALGLCTVSDGILLFLEGEREASLGVMHYELCVGFNICHEVGHPFGLEHSDGSNYSVMVPWDPLNTESVYLSNTSLHKIRKKDYPMH